MAGVVEQNLSRGRTAIALALLAFPVWIIPWPDRAAPLWIAVGLAIELLPPGLRIRRLGGGAIAAGVVMLAQSLVVSAHTAVTARTHDLPVPLLAVLALLMRLLGLDASAGEGSIAVHFVARNPCDGRHLGHSGGSRHPVLRRGCNWSCWD